MSEATYDSSTYSDETYDTGALPKKKRGMSFSVFEWSRREDKEQKPEVFEREIAILQSLQTIQKAEIVAETKIKLLRRGLIKFSQELSMNYELGNVIAAFKLYRAFKVMLHLRGHFIVKMKNGKVEKTFDLGDNNEE